MNAALDIVEPVAKRRKITANGGIKSREIFDNEFGLSGYTITPWKDHKLQIGQWGLKTNTTRLLEWFGKITPQLVTSFRLLARNSEAALYPLLIDLLLPIMELSNFGVISATANIPVDVDVVPEVAESISLAHSPPSSKGYSDEATSGLSGEKGSATEAAEQHHKHLQNVRKIATEIILEIEHIVKRPDLAITGRVELIIGKPAKNSDKVIPHLSLECKVEKLIVNGLPSSGFYQACANLIVCGDARFGVYTNYEEWIFMELLPDKTIIHTNAISFMDSDYQKFHPKCLVVLAHLFQILEVPPTINLPDSVAAAQCEREAAATTLFENVKL